MTGTMAGRLILGLKAALISAAFLVSPALAGREDPTWDPPPEYDFPYPGKMIIRALPQPQVVKECGRISKGHLTALDRRGCSKILSPNVCLVVIVDKTYKRATPKAVLRHEQGHCNGWEHPFTN